MTKQLIQGDNRTGGIVLYSILTILLCAAFVFSVLNGRYAVSWADFFQVIRGYLFSDSDCLRPEINTVIFSIRLPRILASMLIGASLALAGTVFQSIFRNPMVSPGLLGAAHGSGFGAALGILLSFNYWAFLLCSFFFGIGAVLIAYGMSRVFGKERDSVVMLVLSGVVIGSIFSSLISLSKYVADPDDTLPVITFWLMGSLSSVQMKDALLLLIPVCGGVIPLFLIRSKLNILAFGDEEALALGMNTKGVRILCIACSTVITAAAVSLCGIVGWVGLVIPHISRMITGSNHDRLVPVSIMIGALYLMCVDDVSRLLFSVEIPLGILTSLIGAPFFMYLLYKSRRVW